MTRALRTRVARLLGAAVAFTCLAGLVVLADRPEPALAPAADLTRFDPGNIITDAVFYDSGSMNAAQVQLFLQAKGSRCTPLSGGPACLKDYVMATSTRTADSFCRKTYTGASRETAAVIIKKVADACGINPRVLLVTLQKEMGFITSRGPTAKMYERAMGYGCPDNNGGLCDSQYYGFFNQLYNAAKQFRRYAANPTRYAHVPGLVNNVRFHPNSSCGSSPVTIANQATASLYNYTPYQPNAAALQAGYAASSDPCSSYGNRNFYNYFVDWFGSTQTVGRDVDAPTGVLDSVTGGPSSIDVRGWTYDPNVPTAAVDLHVYVDGRLAGAVRTGDPRADVAAAYPGVGPDQGFSGTVAAEPGERTACVYAVNQGAGYTNPRLGCRTVQVATDEVFNPRGSFDRLAADGFDVVASGWAVDMDQQQAAVSVHVYVNGKVVAAVRADQPRGDVGTAFPEAGDAHGFTWTTTLEAGEHRVCLYAINQGRGTVNPRLGCRTVVVESPLGTGSPWGQLDRVSADGTTVTASGWALDPDAPTQPVSVHVYVDGRAVTAVRADGTRADVGRTYPAAGEAHGYTWSGTLTAGKHTVCAYAINVGPPARNPRLGCRTVTVGASTSTTTTSGTQRPIGTLDGVRVTGTTVTATGWTLDQDEPTASLRVHVYVDGAGVGAVTADGARADVGRAYPDAGDAHGYSWSATLAPGPRTVCTYAINVGAATGNPRLGCAEVTVG